MSVGKRLKKARKSLGLSLDDIKNKSKIKKSYLIALENDEYKKLPGEVYTKVYIRGYAKIVELDPQEIIAEYENEKYGSKETKKDNTSKQKQNNNKKQHILNKDGILKSILGIILILIIILLSYNIFIRPDQSQSNTINNGQNTEITQQESNSQDNSNESSTETESDNEKTNQNNNQETIQQKDDNGNTGSDKQEDNNVSDSKSEESNVQSSSVNETEEKTVENKSQKSKTIIEDESKEIRIIANEKSWLQIEVDGELKFQGFINEDEIMTHNGTEKIRIKIGNGIAILVEYKDETLGPFGKRGEVIVKEFDLNN